MSHVNKWLAVALCVFVLIGVNTTWLAPESGVALFGAMGLIYVFLTTTAIKSWNDWALAKTLDYLLVGLTLLVFGYIFVQSETMLSNFWVEGSKLGDRAGKEGMLDIVFGGIGVGLVLEATRRTIGWTLPILCAIFAAYSIYGPILPDWAFPHAGSNWSDMAKSSFLQGGVFGVALKIMFKYVFLFILFGTVLEQTGATSYIIDFARRLFRNSPGGPAKVAVVSSGLMGSLSGSAVANTATTGTFTIPLMKSSGFSANVAGGIEAAASSGGALMPPIMGAGAYMMLELVPGEGENKLEYVDVIKAALLPAVLYYMAVLLAVHFHSKRIGAIGEAQLDEVDEPTEEEKQLSEPDEAIQLSDPQGENPYQTPRSSFSHRSEEEKPGKVDHLVAKQNRDGQSSPYQGFVFFGSFVILIVALLYGLTPFLSVSIGLASVIGLSLLSSSTRLDFSKLVAACEGAAKSGVSLIVAASCVGIILALVQLTGLGNALPPKILALAGGSILAALFLLMVSTIILGMGLPSAVCYLLMATLVKIALVELDTPPLAAHLFIFYFGMMSMVTPPVALAAFAASAISKGDVLRTAFEAFRFALVGFALPFYFVLNPEILMLTHDNQPASWMAIGISVAIVSVAIYGLAAAIAGQAAGRLSWWMRAVLLTMCLIVFTTRYDQQFWLQISMVTGLLVILLIEANTRLFSQQTDPLSTKLS